MDQARINSGLQVEQNTGNFVLSGNGIGGNLQANQNRGTGLTIENNRIDGNQQFQANDPPPVSGNNNAEGREDPCEDLAGASQQIRQYLPVILFH